MRVPSGFVTTTSCVSSGVSPLAGPSGESAVIVVALTTLTCAAERAPTVTVAPATKPLPLSVQVVPPLVGAVAGETEVIDGGGNVEAQRLTLMRGPSSV